VKAHFFMMMKLNWLDNLQAHLNLWGR